MSEAWSYAAAADPHLQAAQHVVLAQTESVRAAHALRSPHLSIGSSYNIRTNEQSIRTPPQPPFLAPGSIPFSQDEGAAFGGLIKVPVYTGGHIGSSVRAAQCGEAAAEQVVQEIRLELKLLVATTFLAVLEAEQMVHTAEKSLQSLEEHVKNVEQLYAKDMAPFTDVLDARSAMADARQRRFRAENDLSLAKAEYNLRLGRPRSARVCLQEPRIEHAAFDLQPALDSALGKRSELTQLQLEAEVLREKAEAIEALDRPQIYMGGAYWFEENRYRTPEGLGSLGVTALWNIYDGHHDTYEAASLLHEASAIKCRQSARSCEIELEIHRAWLKRAEGTRLATEMADSVRLAEENANNVKQRYQVGMATNADVLAAEATRLDSLDRLHRARYAAILAEIKLRRAIGVL